MKCAFPGCDRTLYEENTSGVCRFHNHRRPHCKCVQCTGIQPKYRVISREENNQITKEAIRDAKRKTGITLPVEPWKQS